MKVNQLDKYYELRSFNPKLMTKIIRNSGLEIHQVLKHT